MAGLKGIPATYGGIERAVEEIGARLAARGHEVSVYCRTHYTPDGTRHHRGMTLVRLPSFARRTLDTLSHTALTAFHALGARHDVVHLHSLGNAPFIPLFRIRRPVVLTLHGLETVQAKWAGAGQRYFRACERPACRWPDAVTSVSRAHAAELERRFGRRLLTIPNGAAPQDAGDPAPLAALGLVPRGYLLFMARLVPEKGAHHLIEAYRALDTPLPLVIAGDAAPGDPYVARLKAQAAPDPRIRFTGFAFGETWRALLGHPLFTVHPSESEGLSLGLLESMAFGNAVLVSDLAENLDVTGATGGAWFPSGDAAALRRELAALLTAPDRLVTLRAAARERVRAAYDWNGIVDRYEAVYASITPARPASGARANA